MIILKEQFQENFSANFFLSQIYPSELLIDMMKYFCSSGISIPRCQFRQEFCLSFQTFNYKYFRKIWNRIRKVFSIGISTPKIQVRQNNVLQKPRTLLLIKLNYKVMYLIKFNKILTYGEWQIFLVSWEEFDNSYIFIW